jgi:hypothetical protein
MRSIYRYPLLLLASPALAACGLLPSPPPPPPFPGDGVAGFGGASPVELCLGTARVVSPDLTGGALSVCVPGAARAAPCSAEGDCSGIELCVCGRCIVQACDFGSSCGDGRVCKDQRCTAGCTADADCTAGETCNAGGCARPCSGDGACHHGERCDPLSNVCVAELCSDTLPCAPGDTCEAESSPGYLHEPELVTVGDADVAYVELRTSGQGATASIYRARVDVGGHWTADPGEPVLASSMGQGAGAPSVIVDGQTVEMYFAVGDGQAIARAVSSDGGLTFTPDAAPVLVADPSAAWEKHWVGSPSVVRFQGKTLLFYEGGPRAGVGLARLDSGGAVRLGGPVVTPATVEDLLFWRDVTEVGAPYAVVSGPVLRVYFTGRGVEGSDAVSGGVPIPADPNDSIGMAASLDGTTFSVYPTGPVLAQVTNLRAYLGEREAAVRLLSGGGATITYVATDATGTSESGLAQASQ